MDKRNAFLTNTGLLWLRVLAGSGMAWHGYDKIFNGQMATFTEGVAALGFPVPIFFAWAAALSEFVGGVCIALGLWTPVAALFVFLTMSVAVFVQHANDPFSTKELALAYWTIAGSLMCFGAGNYSLDYLLGKKRKRR